jgi:Type VI secretion system effector, Hcp
MGSRRRHAVEQEPAHEQRRAVVQRAEEQAAGGGGVLALQRSAGNRAVAEQLQVARDDTAVPMDTETKKGHATLTLGGIGSFEIESFGWGGSNSPGAGGGAGQPDLTHVRIMAKKSQLGSAISTLAKAVATGQRIDKAELVQGSFQVQLHDVYIENWQTGSGDDETVSFTLNFGSIHYGEEKKEGTSTARADDPGRGG